MNDRVVWFDLPVADLERASKFYGAGLGIKVSQENAGGFKFAVLDHGPDGNGGCLVPGKASAEGVLVYMNVDGRIRDAVRAVIMDSEGNRVALHSNSDQ